jgi:hypothetical protein
MHDHMVRQIRSNGVSGYNAHEGPIGVMHPRLRQFLNTNSFIESKSC